MPSIPTNLTRLLKATPPAVSFAPGSTFFTRRLVLPEEVQASELDGFVELSLEGLSPFPTDQLYYGYACAEGGGAVFVYAAYRRRYPAEVTRNWAGQAFVVPDFLPLLRLSHAQDTTVFLETAGDLSVLAFRGGKSLPEAVLSRPLPESADPAERTARREALKEAAGRRGLRVAALGGRGRCGPCRVSHAVAARDPTVLPRAAAGNGVQAGTFGADRRA